MKTIALRAVRLECHDNACHRCFLTYRLPFVPVIWEVKGGETNIAERSFSYQSHTLRPTCMNTIMLAVPPSAIALSSIFLYICTNAMFAYLINVMHMSMPQLITLQAVSAFDLSSSHI
jgi:hypothetical protein